MASVKPGSTKLEVDKEGNLIVSITFPNNFMKNKDLLIFKEYISDWVNERIAKSGSTKKPANKCLGKKVLLVDDFSMIRSTVKKILIDLNFAKEPDIQEAEDGSVAIQMLNLDTNFDLIISDWDMPNVTGIEFLKYVRNAEDVKHIPFLMLTSVNKPEKVKIALKAGVSNYIIKPVTEESLKHKLKLLKLI